MISFAVLPAMLWAKYNTAPAYIYEFDKVPVPKPDFPDYGAFHTADIPYALGNLHTWNRPWQADDLAMEKMMSSYWLNFIKTGNPNGAGLPKWNAYDASQHSVMYLANQPANKPQLYQKEISLIQAK